MVPDVAVAPVTLPGDRLSIVTVVPPLSPPAWLEFEPVHELTACSSLSR